MLCCFQHSNSGENKTEIAIKKDKILVLAYEYVPDGATKYDI